MDLIWNKKFMCLPRVSSIFNKKSVLKLFDRTEYFYTFANVRNDIKRLVLKSNSSDDSSISG
jgi:hypothetical protein